MPQRSTQSNTAQPPTWPVPTLVVGIVLLILAPWIPSLIPSSAVWSDEDAQEYTRASADLHAKSYEAAASDKSKHGHSHPGGTADEKAAAKTAFDAIQARRDNAGRLQSGLKYLLQAIGVVACAIGVWGYLRARRS